MPARAALPSLTEVSRASLLSGQLVSGASDTEMRNFKKHSDLMRVSTSQCPPVLFHKGGLTDTGAADLARPVREAIAAEDQRIVGVVINGVDDHLAKGEQINVPWVLPSLPLLKVLMETAATANRFVVITSDHGHVIERQTVYRKGEPGERYRHDDGRPLADELIVAGARVVLPANKRHIASWSERVRYGSKKHGYHGGITPQECLVPLAVLSRPDQSIGNWLELPLYRPPWWEIAPRLSNGSKARRTHATGANNPKGSSRKSQPQDALPLFTTETARVERGAWIDALLDSPAFAAQSKLVGRKAPPRDLVQRFLLALDERGGTLTTASLAQRLEQPEMRVEETIAAMRRLLNVEGYDALSIDETRRIVILDRELLHFVFELAG
ncbi:MAG: BREX-2 system phosphatase PglZ [Acidobacteriota bacterium]|nr:BREX-2 system phosphatase PglZ [Acidobacteriota bacterium]